jgi:uncharacterized membrane protein YfcA
LVVAGGIGGLVSGMFGVGGGAVMVPLLVLVARLDQRRAAATSLLAIIPTALVGATSYGIQGHLALLPALVVAAGAVVGAWGGARLLRVIRLSVLNWLFVVLLVATAGWMAFYVPHRGTELPLGAAVILGLVGLGLVMGLTAGLFGIGGGIVAVPALMALFGAGDLVARGTSLLIMIPAALTGSATNLRARLTNLSSGLVVGLSAAVASLGGTVLAFWLPPRVGNLLFVAMLLINATQLALRSWRQRSDSGQ